MVASPGFIDTNAIRRVRVRVDPADFDPVSVHLHVSRLIGNVPLEVPWLAPSALLCVRRLADPCPGTLPLRTHDLRPPVVWENALRGVLEDRVRTAARPALGPVGEDVEAVLFADRGEMLFCLARDLCRGAACRWWWTTLLRDANLQRALGRELAEHAEYVPAVLEGLSREGLAAVCLERTELADVERILSAVIQRFGLTEVERARGQASPVAKGEGVDVEHDAPALVPDLVSALIGDAAVARLDGARRVVACIAIGLRRSPALVRSRGFAASIIREPRPPADTESCETVRPGSAANEHRAPVALREATATREDGSPAPSEIARPEAATGSEPASIAPNHDAVLAAPSVTEPRAPIKNHPIPPSIVPASETTLREDAVELAQLRTESENRAEPGESPVPEVRRLPAREEIAGAARRQFGVRVPTRLAGLFFLVNAALRLELYPDFTTPASPGLPLPLWDFVSVFGRKLLDDPLDDDPIWALLAELAGRAQDEAPGVGLHEANLTQWVEWFHPRLRRRLLRALGGDEAALALTLLRRRARVHVSPTHLDVVFPLDDLPIEIRFSGLDRDPGWLPTAGCHLTFHFE